METFKFTSSNVNSLEYDGDNHSLYVGFKNGGQYMYIGVERTIWDKLKTASSVGTELHKSILNNETLVAVKMDEFNLPSLLKQLKGLKVLLEMGKLPSAKQLDGLLKHTGVVLPKKKTENKTDSEAPTKVRRKVKPNERERM